MTVVDVEHVTMRRGDHDLLADIRWKIERGQHWALLGANGSGKTTLLKVLTGYMWPTQGEVRVLGKVYGECDLRQLRKSIGWVSSAMEFRVPRTDTALEIVASGFDSSFGLYREMDSSALARCRETLAMVEGAGFEAQSWETLSQGEQKRTLIARALVNRPEVLILDEPCAGLDPVNREAFLEILGKLAQNENAPTVVFVTHHVEEIGPWVSHAIVLKEGRVLLRGHVGDVLNRKVMSEAFGHSCEVHEERGRYRLVATKA